MAGNDSYTKLLLHCDGVDGSQLFPDASASDHTVTAHADAQVDTALQEFGTGSLLLDGTGDYLSVQNHADFNFGVGDFTIDCWVRWGETPTGSQAIMAHYDQGTNQRAWSFLATATGFSVYFSDDGAHSDGHFVILPWTYSIVADTWYHLALVRSGNNVILFVDGILQSSQAMNYTLHDSTANVTIGCSLVSGSPATDIMTGNVDELRVSKGIARWTANFIPSTSAYTSSDSESEEESEFDIELTAGGDRGKDAEEESEFDIELTAGGDRGKDAEEESEFDITLDAKIIEAKEQEEESEFDITLSATITRNYEKLFNIKHTRINTNANIEKTRRDYYNPLSLIVYIDYDLVSDYYLPYERVPFAVYIDNEFYKEFFGTEVKVQLENINIASNIRIFALSNPGFRYIFNKATPGNKIRMRFKAKEANDFDIESHIVYYDNKTGSYESSPIGTIDAITGTGGGRLLKKSKMLSKSEIRAIYPK